MEMLFDFCKAYDCSVIFRYDKDLEGMIVRVTKESFAYDHVISKAEMIYLNKGLCPNKLIEKILQDAINDLNCYANKEE